MKLCFSTLGCPDWSWMDILSAASDMGFPAVEIRGVADNLFAPGTPDFSEEKLPQTLDSLHARGLSIPVLASHSALALGQAQNEENMTEAKAYVQLAQRLGTPYIRVMPTKKPQPEPCDLIQCAALYEELCAFAASFGVTPLMENNSLLGDSRVMKQFMEGIGSENKGVLWDIHHPFRYYGESPEQTFSMIGQWVKHVHVKDSAVRNGVNNYCMMGYGDIPVADCVRVLSEAGYDGYYSLEWVKRWNRELQEPGIVFDHYKYFMTHL